MSNSEKLDFDKKDPFNAKYDKLNRKQIADNLTSILKTGMIHYFLVLLIFTSN